MLWPPKLRQSIPFDHGYGHAEDRYCRDKLELSINLVMGRASEASTSLQGIACNMALWLQYGHFAEAKSVNSQCTPLLAKLCHLMLSLICDLADLTRGCHRLTSFIAKVAKLRSCAADFQLPRLHVSRDHCTEKHNLGSG